MALEEEITILLDSSVPSFNWSYHYSSSNSCDSINCSSKNSFSKDGSGSSRVSCNSSSTSSSSSSSSSNVSFTSIEDEHKRPVHQLQRGLAYFIEPKVVNIIYYHSVQWPVRKEPTPTATTLLSISESSSF